MFGIQLDEIWSFVQKKSEKQCLPRNLGGIWIALNPYNRPKVAFHVGGGEKKCSIFFNKIPNIFKQEAAFLQIIGTLTSMLFQKKNTLLLVKEVG